MFTPNQIEELKKIIDRKVTTFAAQHLSTDLLTSDEKRILRQAGINISTINPKNSMVYQSFAFGVMSGAVPKSKLNKLTYNDFVKYINSKNFIPLTTPELAQIKSLQEQSLHDIRGIKNRFEDFVGGDAISANRRVYEDTIRGEITRGQAEGRSLRVISNEISKKLGDFGRNFDKSVQYVSNAAFQYGRAAFIERNYGDDAKAYFDVYGGACKSCIKHHLTEGVGSKPKVYTLEQLRANGSNIGKKQKDWKANLNGMHIHCRCTLNVVPEGYAWNEEEKRFAPSTENRKVDRKSKIGIKFGDQEYTI